MSQRTRQIAIRTAIGARRFGIVVQFPLEASVLTGLGGLAGLGLAGRLRWCILVFTSLAGCRARLGGFSGIVVSAGALLFFGIWPASKAAKPGPRPHKYFLSPS